MNTNMAVAAAAVLAAAVLLLRVPGRSTPRGTLGFRLWLIVVWSWFFDDLRKTFLVKKKIEQLIFFAGNLG